MISILQQFWRFLKFYLKADTVYGIHAPFAFAFANEVLESKEAVDGKDKIEALRIQLKQQDQKIEVTDFGAGSQIMNGQSRRIKDIAKISAGDKKSLQILSRTISKYDAREILELGTSLGISAAYMAMASRGNITTLEGCPATAKVAAQNFENLRLENIRLIQGDFQNTLPALFDSSYKPDLIYFDGDHRRDAVRWQVETCYPHLQKAGVLIFDDIYWSADMMQAWKEIEEDPRFMLTLDLFFTGFAFIQPDIRVKQKYKLVPKAWKPWQTGIRLFHPRN
ncbi:MAG: class I SAM-dependent methyltransferase [Bacteroidetes bacterium]|nr:class I SAM-dependent methyltransferase [Bacteroidota bacterium]